MQQLTRNHKVGQHIGYRDKDCSIMRLVLKSLFEDTFYFYNYNIFDQHRGLVVRVSVY